MTTPTRKPDRRIQRTRQLLRDALMQLIVEKGYESLTVQDITDRADVARTTFYLHYKDIDELLFISVAEMYQELMFKDEPFRLPLDSNLDSQESFVNKNDFEHVAKYADFYRIMLSPKGSMTFMLQIQTYLGQIMEEHLRQVLPPDIQPRVPLDLLAFYWAGAEIGIMTWWLKQDNLQHSPEAMARFTELISFGDIKHILGISETTKK